MKVIYTSQQPSRPGYGVLIASELGAAPGEASFMLKRASDRKCLADSGWQEAEVYIKPERADMREDGLYLYIGPQVVDNLDMQESYRFYLTWPGASPLSAGLKVEGLIYSPLSGGAGIAQAEKAALKGPLTPPGKTEEKSAPEPQDQPAPQTTASAGREERPSAPQAQSNKKQAIMWAVIIALFLALGGGIYYLVNKDSFEKESAALPPLEEAYKYLSGDKITAEESYNLAERLWKETSDNARDAAFLLYEDAANKGMGAAMLMLGRYYDPVEDTPHGSIIKDAEQAFAWYEKALNAGETDAKNKIDTLRKWVEENE